MPHDWIVPDWPVPAHVRAVCTTRRGGVSEPPWDSLNLGGHVGDAPEAVATNRARLQRTIGVRPVFLDQVHGHGVVDVDAETPDGRCADGGVTGRAGVACTVLVADCLPVLLTDARGLRVAAAHAGWRGLAGGVLGAVVQRLLRSQAHADQPLAATDVIAWLGPCIGPHEFEVGADVRHAFEACLPDAGRFFLCGGKHGKWYADLAGLARLQLGRLGVTQIHGNDASPGWCTMRNPSRYFSHRRDGRRLGASGRFAASIWLDGGRLPVV